MPKKLLEYFKKYKPDDETALLLDGCEVGAIRVDKTNKKIEMDVTFPKHVPFSDLRTIEKDMARAHEINDVHLFPIFPEETFGEQAIEEAVYETFRTTKLSNGFLNQYTFNILYDTIEIFTRFDDNTNNFMVIDGSDKVIASFIKKMYNKDFTVVFKTDFENIISYEDF